MLAISDRKQVWRGLMRYLSMGRESLGLSKSDLQAAIDATDVWVEDNQASFNNTLPAIAKTNLTANQKTLIFCAVAARRVGVEFSRKLFGELD